MRQLSGSSSNVGRTFGYGNGLSKKQNVVTLPYILAQINNYEDYETHMNSYRDDVLDAALGEEDEGTFCTFSSFLSTRQLNTLHSLPSLQR